MTGALTFHPGNDRLTTGRGSSGHLTAYLSEAAERWPERTVMVDGEELTYGRAWYKILQIATWLQQNGVQRGDRVIAVLRQSPELHLIALAVAHAGAIISVLSPQVRSACFATILEESQPICVFLERTSRHLRAKLDNVLTVWMDEGLNQGGWEEADYREIKTISPAWGMPYPGRASDPAFLVYPQPVSESAHGELWSHERVRDFLTRDQHGAADLLSVFHSTDRECEAAAVEFDVLSANI